MPPKDEVVQFALPRNDVGQILDGLEVLIEQWEGTAAFFRTGEIGDGVVRECADAEEAESIAELYRKILMEVRRQVR